ncbi:MAG: ABC transporter substrate-binding protein [Acidimicrobiales bacterium]
MKYYNVRAAAVLVALGLVGAACGDDNAASSATTTVTVDSTSTSTVAKNTASDTGATETTIKIAILQADLSGLVKAGAIKGVPEDSAQGNARRITHYLDEWNKAGGINGRTLTSQLVTWNPADPKTYQTACQEIIDAKVFMVISGVGYPADSIPCITVDGKTQFIGIDAVSSKQAKDMGSNWIGLAPPGAAGARAGAEALVKDANLLPKGAKVAVLRSDFDFATDAFTEIDKVLKAASVNVVFSEAIRTANIPTADANKNVTLAVEKIKAAGATYVIDTMPFPNFSVFPPEATKSGLDLRYAIIEISSGMCAAFSAGQLPAPVNGAPCVTHWDNVRIDTNGTIKSDSPFEAQCRKDFDATYAAADSIGKGYPAITKSNPGVPYPGLKDGTGKQLDMDQSYFECDQMNIVKAGIAGAGANLTKKTFQDAVFKQGTFDAAGLAGGKGTLSSSKTWLATNLQQVVVTANPDGFKAAADTNGLYQGKCPSPLSCFRTVPNTLTSLTYTLG